MNIYLPETKVNMSFASPDQAAWLITNFVDHIKNAILIPDVYRDFVDGEAIADLLNSVCYPFTDDEDEAEMALIVFTDTENSELVGGVLVSIDNKPWFAKKGTLCTLNEVATFSVPGHSGVTRMAIEAMHIFAEVGIQDCPVVIAAGASLPMSSGVIFNSYRKAGFASHPCFYKLIEP